jgi:hypothetical protein
LIILFTKIAFKGDSGGPLVIYKTVLNATHSRARSTIVGVASVSYDYEQSRRMFNATAVPITCADENIAINLWVSVAFHLNWIQDFIKYNTIRVVNRLYDYENNMYFFD